MKFMDVVSKFDSAKKSGGGFSAKCPAHEDMRNSLSIGKGDDGKTILNCHAGCDPIAVCSAVGLHISDLFDSPSNKHPRRREVAAYPYCDEYGTLLYENVRYEPKDFRWRRKEEGRVIWNLKDTRRVPYRLPELLDAVKNGVNTVFTAEGEKDADNLRAIGFAASSFKNWRPEFNCYIEGSDVVLFRDHDTGGVKQAEDAARLISTLAKSVKVIDLFDDELVARNGGKDVSDWLEARRNEGLHDDDISELLAVIVEKAGFWSSVATDAMAKDRLKVKRMSDVEAIGIEWLIKPLIPFSFFTLCDGIEGVGKTYMMLDVANRLSRGLPMPISDESLAPAKILIMSEEDSPEHVLKPRLEKMGANMENIFILDGPFTTTESGLSRLEKTIASQNIRFVLIDPLMSYTGTVNVNSTSDVRPITDRLNKIASVTGSAIIGIRHINKSKGLGEARSAGSHSVAWLQGARSALIIGCDPDDKSKRAIGQHKLNIGAESKATYGFQIANEGLFEWTGESDLTIERMLSNRQSGSVKRKTAIATAIEFLTERLSIAGGAMMKSEIDEVANDEGIANRTLERAKHILGVRSEKIGIAGGWQWTLPNPEGRQEPPPAR